jgi:predicted secreted protein
MIWWVVLFTVLPFGVKVAENPEKGHADGAPERPMMWRKVGITTLVACVVWLGVYVLVESDLISIRGQ